MNERGHTLIELIFAIGIVMAAVVGVFVLAGQVDSTRALREASDANALVQAITTVHGAGRGHYGGIEADVLIEHLAPARLEVDGGLRSAWGEITVAPIDVDGRHNAGFRVVYANVPADECMDFVKGLGLGERGVFVGEIQVTDYGRLDRPGALAACQTGGTVAIEHFASEPGQP